MCAFVLAALFGPRVGIVLLWLFTDRMTRAYETGLVPVLGFFVLPWTTFLYGLVQGGGGAVGAFGVFVIVIGFIIDVVSYISAFGANRRRASY